MYFIASTPFTLQSLVPQDCLILNSTSLLTHVHTAPIDTEVKHWIEK